MQTHRDTDEAAPTIPQFSCTCGASFPSAGKLLSHTMTCQQILAAEDHD